VSQIAEAMVEVAHAVDRIRESTASIAGAVEQQGAATQEISRSVAAAASGAAEITEGARRLETVAGRASGTAHHVAEASADLSQRAKELDQQANKFMGRIRTADRRNEPRREVNMTASLVVDGVAFEAFLNDISTGGASVRMDISQLPANPREVVLRVPGSQVSATMRIVRITGSLINLAFVDPAVGTAAARWFTSRDGQGARAA
jgi:uncharacterized protein YoxC